MSETRLPGQLDHIGIQVRAIEPAIEQLTALFGYRQATEPVVNTRQGVRVVFLEKAGSIPLKLFCPLDGKAAAAAKLHHLAFRYGSVDEGVRTLSERGARVLSPAAPGEAFDEEPIAFLYAAGLNVEVVATDKRRGRLPGGSDGGTT